MEINRDRTRAAQEFVKRWQNKGNEKQHTQSFWLDLLSSVYGVESPTEYITFEDTVMMDHTSFMDGYIETTKVLIEQKGANRNLNSGIRQSDGTLLTPFQQAKRYSANMPYSKRPRWIITCNFKEFYIYDMENPNAEPSILALEDLHKEYYRLEILLDKTNEQIEKETKVSLEAGELVGEIYNELLKQYKNPEDPHTLKSINILCVRLVFCFYAEDAELFGPHGMFGNYLQDYDTRFFRDALINLFKVLDTKTEDRDPYLDEKLAAFPYVNGGLFAEEDIEIPQFNDHLRELIIKNACSDFDWSEISPTIFGGVFESTLNPEERRSGGMHYTSIENIHKVIDPLFLNELKYELNQIKQLKQPATIEKQARAFQNKLAGLRFLDPACGSGNFLTETYLELRRLENQAIYLIYKDYSIMFTEAKDEEVIKVSLDQFYGIEINDFAVSVAKTALWIAESQMFKITRGIVYFEKDFFPLKSYLHIKEANALTFDWKTFVEPYEIDYIMGNPPFVGHSMQSEKQKKEMRSIYVDKAGKEYRLAGKIDYVAGWFFKASQFIENTPIKVAFVATNSITQGEQVEGVWEPLYERFRITPDFGYKTFAWNSETLYKANVHVVIIGFSWDKSWKSNKLIFRDSGSFEIADELNFYLNPGPIVFVKSRRKPISDVSPMVYGSKPTDGGHFFLTPEEKAEFIKREPITEKYIHRVIGASEFINGTERYCLWLADAEPQDLRKSRLIMDRINKVREFRLASKAKSTVKFADEPTRFKQLAQPDTPYLVVPRVSSERRRYIPIGYVDPSVIATDALQIVPNATLYEFGIITSNIHMAWMRMLAGRLKSDYRYSNVLVYNTFPWPEVTPEQRNKIKETAQAILDARALYPDASLADLYDPLTMPPELIRAHQDNDRAVMQAYGLRPGKDLESDAVALLMDRYEKLIADQNKG